MMAATQSRQYKYKYKYNFKYKYKFNTNTNTAHLSALLIAARSSAMILMAATQSRRQNVSHNSRHLHTGGANQYLAKIQKIFL